ncbi:MarR family transcriptional regulator [Saccharibacillus sp. CPCC 101409]|uniref:MarR family winged helix-turn-helix transcriptional regulator n=1 Tax=Saccharibacillus sp. CPCC 101409 TaxID=3058041 RepID=UPI00267162BB|nr:MarR family transcriptional regulator [Saccharibacillus sp. CPCC 101409]MDO3411650.1 MarR family transcriptional regulator [Saccharibacillus sp. CPCC 101409]
MIESNREDYCVLERLQLLNNRLGSAFSGCAGISASRFRLMQELFAAEEIGQTSLQKLLGIDGAAVTRHLKQLESRGFVSRRSSPEDNRVTLVRLTQQGREHIDGYIQEKSRLVEQLLDGFGPEERKQLADMLERLQSNAESL